MRATLNVFHVFYTSGHALSSTYYHLYILYPIYTRITTRLEENDNFF